MANGIEEPKSRASNIFQDIQNGVGIFAKEDQNANQLGKRVTPDAAAGEDGQNEEVAVPARKQQKIEIGTTTNEVSSSEPSPFSAKESVSQKRNQKRRNAVNDPAAPSLASQRQKRDAKKVTHADELYDYTPDVSLTSQKVVASSKQVSLKHQKIDDNKDPIHIMYKHILEPIITYDRLDVLNRDKYQFEIFLKAKDFKNLSKERKEDMLQQRVHFDKDDGMVVHVDLDPEFSRHTFQASNLAANG